MSAELMVRTRLFRPLPARIAIGAGMLTAGAVVALAHLAGADMRALSGNQAGLLAALVRGQSEAGAHAATPAAQP